ncbi:MAG: hypothetical protein METHP_01603 [Methanoregula sp. SKADARSKE-2]|nr:MAG: hypothetical protein METHP_01603 [Methanoregula sp. SKADARSKE-2]
MKNRSSYSETPGIRCQRLPGIPFDMIMSIHEMELPQYSSSLKPLKGGRRVNPRKHRKKVDWAHEVRELLEIDYPNARKIILICDNLNTHTIGAFYEAFPPEEASILVKLNQVRYPVNVLIEDWIIWNCFSTKQKSGKLPETITRNWSTGSLLLKVQGLN